MINLWAIRIDLLEQLIVWGFEFFRRRMANYHWIENTTGCGGREKWKWLNIRIERDAGGRERVSSAAVPPNSLPPRISSKWARTPCRWHSLIRTRWQCARGTIHPRYWFWRPTAETTEIYSFSDADDGAMIYRSMCLPLRETDSQFHLSSQ